MTLTLVLGRQRDRLSCAQTAPHVPRGIPLTQATDSSGLQIWSRRLFAAIMLAGQVVMHLISRPIHRRNTLEQMAAVGPESLLIALLTASFVGMVFTIQVTREFLNFGAGTAVGGVLALTLARELAPVLTAVILAGRVGSAFAAEIGTMRVTEQIDALQILKTDPIDYLVIPRVVACALMLPVLSLLSFITGMTGGLLIATNLYGISQQVFITSAQNFLTVWDLVSSLIKAFFFGILIAVIGSSWGLTTTGGAKGVGQSTTTAVVTALLAIFISNFFLSWLMFQGVGSALLGGM
ncbi:MAG: MlaE family lipid ABC transporter permease subunit [Leptolyngbyaceae cyanobacterium T60_A2020_046]|nr:MlaE family lipid ABC transporter permease subunit [Leptolyngbyaceae cyanobacterium T60_A2020_046]